MWLGVSIRFWSMSLVGGVALAFAACSDDSGGGGGGSGGGAGDAAIEGGDSGGSDGDAHESGTPLAKVCVKSPVPAAWPGDASCPVAKPGVADALDEALTKAGVDRCSYGFSDAAMAIWKPIFADDKYQLPTFRPLHLAILRAPGFVKESENLLDAALDGAQPVSSAILFGAARKSLDIDACADLSPFEASASETSPLAAALATLISEHGGIPDAAALATETQAVPKDLQKALVPILASLSFAAKEFRASLGTDVAEDLDWLERVHGLVIVPPEAYAIDKTEVARLEKVDQKRMAAAAALVARAVEDAKLESFTGANVTPLAIDTPIGAFVLGGPGADHFQTGELAERAALLLDVGGDDSYEVPAGAGRRDVPVSLAIDLGGKDQYGYVAVPDAWDAATRPPSDAAGRTGQFGVQGQTLSRVGRQGSGVLGIGLLFDLGSSDDSYASLALSQGAGSMGIGVLYDAGGSDKYIAESTSQGSALFGIGALVDASGNDEYRTFFASQGFGFVRGVGFVAEGGGDDVYFADPGDPKVGGDPLYPSAQLPGEGNTSMCQGAGFGRRDDNGKLYMAGGHGLLYDRAGADHYTASVFAQGSGYWLGLGVLADKAGNDRYDGLWYVQGASAHFALGFHFDHAGDDIYDEGFPIRATSIGVGHDFSGALHVDEAGNDKYTAPGLSLGCGNSQGAGGFIDIGGTDTYAPAGNPSYGCASLGHGAPFTSRDDLPTIGIFVDVEGSDSYALPTGAPAAGDGATWSFPVMAGTAGAPSTEKSGGVDRSPGTVGLP